MKRATKKSANNVDNIDNIRPRSKTMNRGAADARALCKEAVQAELKQWKGAWSEEAVKDFAKAVLARISAQAKNASKRSGGLGRPVVKN